jgi:FdhE protein
MAQRILEPGQIETLARASIPRVRLPDRDTLFAQRAARLRKLSPGASIGDYLNFLAVLVDAQHAALARLTVPPPDKAHVEKSVEHGMPPIQASASAGSQQWRETLEFLCAALAARSGFPPGVRENISRIRRAAAAWIESQAIPILEARNEDAIDASVAPIIMAALQVHWVALAGHFVADQVKALDVPGLCPLCGTLPVASVVCAQSPYQGYRYLHCALCATEWHMVRVQCSACGASGKDIGYNSLKSTAADNLSAAGGGAVRAETCEQCRGYRKIMYQEHDTGVDPVADDLASLALDLLLGEQGYHRASGNPLLWMPNPTSAP